MSWPCDIGLVSKYAIPLSAASWRCRSSSSFDLGLQVVGVVWQDRLPGKASHTRTCAAIAAGPAHGLCGSAQRAPTRSGAGRGSAGQCVGVQYPDAPAFHEDPAAGRETAQCLVDRYAVSADK